MLASFSLALAVCSSAAGNDALPHHEEIVPGVHAVGFADLHRSANCGFVELEAATLLVDLPRGIEPAAFVSSVAKTTGKPAASLILTHATPDDLPIVDKLVALGVTKVYLSPGIYQTLTGDKQAAKVPAHFHLLTPQGAIGDAKIKVEAHLADNVFAAGAAWVIIPDKKVMFAGPLVIQGPRAPLPGSDTAAWVAALEQLAAVGAERVVPGFGSFVAGDPIVRQHRYLVELRRQVGQVVALGRNESDLPRDVRLGPETMAWMPYDTPVLADLEHVFRELIVPAAPFGGKPPAIDAAAPHALVLIGDGPHEPGHIELGLRPVFAATGVTPHFAVDTRALSAENLARVRLLVILRDGLARPRADGSADHMWMTPEQERAVVEFVERGGGFLNLHNSLGIYPPGGPYLQLLGGEYTGHGPLERFQVEVVAPEHPVTRGVHTFAVADEQHTPRYDAQKVRLLLQSRSDAGATAAAGWVREPGKGRLCHLANGHTREALLDPMMQRLMQNAVRWCLRDGKD